MLILAATPPAAADPSAKVKSMIDSAAGLCGQHAGKDIVVCGRRGDSPYRLPEAFRGDQGFDIDGPIDSVARERHRLMDVGGAGSLQNTCSTTGGGGAYGCLLRGWQAADQQRGYRH